MLSARPGSLQRPRLTTTQFWKALKLCIFIERTEGSHSQMRKLLSEFFMNADFHENQRNCQD